MRRRCAGVLSCAGIGFGLARILGRTRVGCDGRRAGIAAVKHVIDGLTRRQRTAERDDRAKRQRGFRKGLHAVLLNVNLLREQIRQDG